MEINIAYNKFPSYHVVAVLTSVYLTSPPPFQQIQHSTTDKMATHTSSNQSLRWNTSVTPHTDFNFFIYPNIFQKCPCSWIQCALYWFDAALTLLSAYLSGARNSTLIFLPAWPPLRPVVRNATIYFHQHALHSQFIQYGRLHCQGMVGNNETYHTTSLCVFHMWLASVLNPVTGLSFLYHALVSLGGTYTYIL
jgi:hypothetical protein